MATKELPRPRWLGVEFKRLLLSSSYTQADIAKRLGVEDSTVARWTGNESAPSAGDLLRLASLLKVSPLAFFDLNGLEFDSSLNVAPARPA